MHEEYILEKKKNGETTWKEKCHILHLILGSGIELLDFGENTQCSDFI